MNQREAGEAGSSPGRRLLWWIPIVHTQEDMGQLKGSVETLFIRRFGKAKWEAHRRTVSKLWQDIRHLVERAPLPFDKVRLYQDGLPLCGQEERIVRELAAQGSANHKLLADLIDRGATLTGTESPELLIEEYTLNQRILAIKNGQPPAKLPNDIDLEAKTLLDKRDQFIADRIDQTLRIGELGLLFLGMLHSIESKLPADIDLVIKNPGDRFAHARR
jgi:hypothetical protein